MGILTYFQGKVKQKLATKRHKGKEEIRESEYQIAGHQENGVSGKGS
jgi:hypothetical protein